MEKEQGGEEETRWVTQCSHLGGSPCSLQSDSSAFIYLRGSAKQAGQDTHAQSAEGETDLMNVT